MANLIGVRASLAQRIEWIQRQSEKRASKRFTINTGYRSDEEQWFYWNNWQAGIRKYGSANAARAHGIPIAAYPGTSNHQHKDAKGNPDSLAVDLGCLVRDNAVRIELVKEAGCCTPVAGEPWHVEERANAAIPIDQKAVQMSDSPYINVPCSTGGYWRLQRSNGGVGALSGAPFFGSLPGVKAKVVAPLVGLTECKRGGQVIGYWVFDQIGNLYSFGDAPYFTSYAEHPEWHSPNSLIDGLVQTAGTEKGTQIRYCFTRYEIGDAEYIPDTYDIGREFKK